MAEPFPLPAAVRLRHDDVRADRHGVKEIDDQIGDHAAHRHGGEGILVHQIPGDQGVHAVVKVLQQLAQNERDRKAHNGPDDVPLGKIDLFFHFAALPPAARRRVSAITSTRPAPAGAFPDRGRTP